jgi:hypothetical protein
MIRVVRFLNPISIAESRLQRPHLLEAVLGIPFVLFLVMGATLWDEMVFAGEPVTQSSRIGLAISLGACVLLLTVSRRKWPLLLCAFLFASVRIPNVWLGSPFPDSLRLPVDCLAVSISLFAVIFRTEIAEVINRTRQPKDSWRSRAQAGPAVGSPMASHPLVTLSNARAASTPVCTVEPLPSSPA